MGRYFRLSKTKDGSEFFDIRIDNRECVEMLKDIFNVGDTFENGGYISIGDYTDPYNNDSDSDSDSDSDDYEPNSDPGNVGECVNAISLYLKSGEYKEIDGMTNFISNLNKDISNTESEESDKVGNAKDEEDLRLKSWAIDPTELKIKPSDRKVYLAIY